MLFHFHSMRFACDHTFNSCVVNFATIRYIFFLFFTEIFLCSYCAYAGKTVPLEEEHEVSMFKRILEMRSKLESIIQLQTIKYQVRFSALTFILCFLFVVGSQKLLNMSPGECVIVSFAFLLYHSDNWPSCCATPSTAPRTNPTTRMFLTRPTHCMPTATTRCRSKTLPNSCTASLCPRR